MAERLVDSTTPWHLLLQPNELIGRDADVASAREALLKTDCRLLTMLGPGGIGKTRLAIAVAESLASNFAHGVCFVDLAQIADASSVPSQIAAQLDLPVEGTDPLERVRRFLRDQEVLVVLDTFERVLPAALVVAELVEVCPRLKVLTTSREPLRLRWEHRMAVQPLELPNPDARPPAEELMENPAVALFVQRARARDMGFKTSDETLRQIAALCVRLEGVPLAIELAAARTNILSPTAILERLEVGTTVLRQPARDVPARHRSIEAVVDWSYRLLEDEERTLLRHLSIFVGGFTLEAAVMTAGDEQGTGVLNPLSALVDKALVTFDPTHEDAPWYRLPDTVRAYAIERLGNSDEREEVARRHANYYARLAERESARLHSGGYFVFLSSSGVSEPYSPEHPPGSVGVDTREHANLQAALIWAKVHDAPLLMRLATALARYWWVRGSLPEGTRWLEAALERNPEAEPALRSRALNGLGIMYRQQADFERACRALEEAVALTRAAGDAESLAAQLIDLSGVRGSQGQFEGMTTLIEEAAELSHARGDTWGAAVALTYLGWRDLTRVSGADAEPHLAAALEVFRGFGDLRSAAIVEATLAYAVGLQGDARRALPLLDDAMALCRELGQDPVVALVLEITGSVLSEGTSPRVCALLLGAGDALRERGHSRVTMETVFYDRGLAAIQARLGVETRALLAQGWLMSREQAIEEALSLIQQETLALGGVAPQPAKRDEDSLSEREREVLELMVGGCSNREIGRHLTVSENTAKYHVASILNKLGASNRAEAVNVAVRRGLVAGPANPTASSGPGGL
jgi:non-specific serine/threonine protein kinase